MVKLSANLIVHLTLLFLLQVCCCSKHTTAFAAIVVYMSFLIRIELHMPHVWILNPFCRSFFRYLLFFFSWLFLRCIQSILILNTFISLPQTIYQTQKKSLTYRQIHFRDSNCMLVLNAFSCLFRCSLLFFMQYVFVKEKKYKLGWLQKLPLGHCN